MGWRFGVWVPLHLHQEKHGKSQQAGAVPRQGWRLKFQEPGVRVRHASDTSGHW